MAEDTRGWFFVATRTTRANGTTTHQIKGGGRPAMILAIGAVLAGVYLIYMLLADPSKWEAAGGAILAVVAFVGLFVYFTEVEHRNGPGVSKQTDENSG